MRARVLLSVFVLLLQSPSQALALPVFAHRYGLSCQVCHTIVPHLTPFGQSFLRAGFRLPSTAPAHGTGPVAVKVNFQYSTTPNPDTLPKVILDELEFLSAASVTSHLSYRIEQYAVDGGFPGLTRDAWLMYTSHPDFGYVGPALRGTAGQFTLPLPDDPETQRPTQNHYLIFDQTVGSNPFNLFDDRIGLNAAYGRQIGGFDFQALAMKGHDPQSGLPTDGIDTMFEAAQAGERATFTAYWYRGQRPLGLIADDFARQALAANLYFGKAEIDVLAQSGFDSSAHGYGDSLRSSGGFGQVWWWFSPALLGVARYDFDSDTQAGADRSMTASLVYRPYRNASVTVEKVFGWGHNTTDAAWLFAY